MSNIFKNKSFFNLTILVLLIKKFKQLYILYYIIDIYVCEKNNKNNFIYTFNNIEENTLGRKKH